MQEVGGGECLGKGGNPSVWESMLQKETEKEKAKGKLSRLVLQAAA